MVHVPRATRRVLLGAGAALLLAALLWRPIAVSLLVKFPTNLDQATAYEGTFTAYVDPGTGVPLASPLELPLDLERRIRTIPEESGARTVVVQELVTFRIAGTEQQEIHQYVMDRRSMENRDDPRSYAYDPGNVVDRTGTHRVNLPLSTKQDGQYLIWENEPGAGFPMVGRSRQVDRDGLSLVEMEEVFGDVPVADAYRGELRKQGFTVEITFDALAARLAATGVDVEAALAALPESDAATVAGARRATLPLRFFRYNDGRALVEPRTGAIVDLLRSEEGISATVELDAVSGLREALARSNGQPAAAALGDALDQLESAAPARVYHLDYGQTDASVVEIVELTRNELRKLDMAERTLPLALGAIGAMLLGVGAVVRRPARQRAIRSGSRKGYGRRRTRSRQARSARRTAWSAAHVRASER